MSSYVTSLDATVKRVRDTIYRLHADGPSQQTLVQRLGDVIERQTAEAGLRVETEYRGAVADLETSDLADDVLAVIREALSNVVRHAQATVVAIRISVTADSVTVDVTDDGIGVGTPDRASGLANMTRRAYAHGGNLQLNGPPRGGTHLHWTAHRR
ncbi:MAG TPA: ATP-binding protein [Microlunatus sp.]|nr:ATP-binding protein [Microlunatus sp.]